MYSGVMVCDQDKNTIFGKPFAISNVDPKSITFTTGKQSD
jgi:hypothetical protein